jgi:glycosyltransferase involved in cell wall biosynthesis
LVFQTLADIEIIVINDASTDGSTKIIEDYAILDSRFHVLENSKNQNLFETRRRGFAAATGAYIATCDSDDYMPRTALKQLYETARRTEADIVHGCADELVDERHLGWHINSPFNVSSGCSFVESMLRLERGWHIWGKLHHRSVVEKALKELPVNKRLFMGEDLLFSFFFGLQAGRYSGCREIVYHYRTSRDSYYNHPEEWPQHIADYFDVLSMLKARMERKDIPLEHNLLQGWIKTVINGIFRNLPIGADLAAARGLITERLGKSYLMDIYGQNFNRSPLGDDNATAGRMVRPAKFIRKALFPGRIIFLVLSQLREKGFYEFSIRCRQWLTFIRRKGYKYFLRKLTARFL